MSRLTMAVVATVVAFMSHISFTNAFSSGVDVNLGSCDPVSIGDSVGCVAGWTDPINDPRTKTGYQCLDGEPLPIMHWASRAARNSAYTLRTTDSPTPESDPLTYAPGEIVPVYVRATAFDARFRGLLVSALRADDRVAVGRWEIPNPDTALYRTLDCPNPDANYVVHNAGTLKPYLTRLYWRAPQEAGQGDVIIDALIKRGFANEGDFHYPNMEPLVLKERTPSTVRYMVGDAGQSCTDTCTAIGKACLAEAMTGFQSGSDFVSKTGATLTCEAPVYKSCDENMHRVDGGSCYWSATTDVNTICDDSASETMRICACSSSSSSKVAPNNRLLIMLIAIVAIVMLIDEGATASSGALATEVLPAVTATTILALLQLHPREVMAHNWQWTNVRGTRAASVERPCIARRIDEVHAQVNPAQEGANGGEVIVEWATGHFRDHFVIAIAGEHYEKLSWANLTIVMNQYLDDAPDGKYWSAGGVFDPNDTSKPGAKRYQRIHSLQQSFTSSLGDIEAANPILKRELTLDPVLVMTNVTGGKGRAVIGGMSKPETNSYYSYKHNDLVNGDRFASYRSTDPNLSWIDLVMRFDNIVSRPSDSDGVLVPFMDHVDAGHHIIMWKWSGFTDCTDVNVHVSTDIHPDEVYGTLDVETPIKYERVDHCTFDFENVITPMFEMKDNTIEECVAAVDDYLTQPARSLANPYGRIHSLADRKYGIQVQPMEVHVRAQAPVDTLTPKWRKDEIIARSDLLVSRPRLTGTSKLQHGLANNGRGHYDDSMMDGLQYVLSPRGRQCKNKNTYLYVDGRFGMRNVTLRQAIARCDDKHVQRGQSIDKGCTGLQVELPAGVTSLGEVDSEYVFDNIVPCFKDYDTIPDTDATLPDESNMHVIHADSSVFAKPQLGIQRQPAVSSAFNKIIVSFAPDKTLSKVDGYSVLYTGTDRYSENRPTPYGTPFSYGWESEYTAVNSDYRTNDPDSDGIAKYVGTNIIGMPGESVFKASYINTFDINTSDSKYGYTNERVFRVSVPNGFYKVSVVGGTPGSFQGGSLGGCTVNGYSTFTMDRLEGNTAPVSTVYHKEVRVHVTDGNIRFSSLFGDLIKVRPEFLPLRRTVGFSNRETPMHCGRVAGLLIERIAASEPSPMETWIPPAQDPWWYTEIYDENGVEVSKSTAIGVVSVTVVPAGMGSLGLRTNRADHVRSGLYDFGPHLLFKGWYADRSWIPEASLVGQHYDLDQEGFIVGISDEPCDKVSGCRGHVCDHWTFAHGALDPRSRYGSANIRYTGTYNIDCKGKQGKYVWIKLPGDKRVIPELDVTISRYNFPPPPQAEENEAVTEAKPNSERLVCYGVKNRIPGDTGLEKEYYVEGDPENTGYFNTCFERKRNIEWLDFSPNDVASVPSNLYKFEVQGQCISCGSFQANANLPNNTIYPWVLSDDCYDCGPSGTDALLDVCPVETVERTVNYFISVGIPIIVILLVIVIAIASLFLVRHFKPEVLERVPVLRRMVPVTKGGSANIDSDIANLAAIRTGGSNASIMMLTVDAGAHTPHLSPSTGTYPDVPSPPTRPLPKPCRPVSASKRASKGRAGKWETRYDDDGYAYYYNPVTQISQWEPPAGFTAY